MLDEHDIANRVRSKHAELSGYQPKFMSTTQWNNLLLLTEILCEHDKWQVYDAPSNSWVPSERRLNVGGGCYCRGCGKRAEDI